MRKSFRELEDTQNLHSLKSAHQKFIRNIFPMNKSSSNADFVSCYMTTAVHNKLYYKFGCKRKKCFPP